ncbi:hypothetical protein [Devosia sp. A369]
MPEISERLLAAFHQVAHDAAALAKSIQHDETGDLIAGQFVGNGNGGNISRESLRALGQLQFSLNELPAGGEEG